MDATLTRRQRASAPTATLAEILRRRAETAPEATAYRFLTWRDGTAPDAAETSNAACLRRAEAIAARLQDRARPQDRVLILCAPGIDYVAAFLACQLARTIAVPAYPPRNLKRIERLEAIVDDAEAAVVLSDGATARRLDGWAGLAPRGLALIDVEAIPDEDAAGFRQASSSPEDVAFLQYTSGSTGTPKGVVVRQRHVLTNVAAIARLFDLSSESRVTSWLPPYHDMGLVGSILTPLVVGFTSTLMTPAAFVQRPARWLEAMDAHRATITTAPNFGWQLCVDEVAEEVIDGLDLSALSHALSGAEPVRRRTVEGFAGRFRRAGFRREAFAPVYGMAETVLIATGPRRRPSEATPVEEPTTGSVVPCGVVIPDHDLRVVDPDTGRERAEGEVGEVWIAGLCVADGYWRKEDASREAFGARLAGATDGPAYLRTGDLGALRDGHLTVHGRIKETIVLRGRNFTCHDLEETAAGSDPSLGSDRTIAFAADDGEAERVVLLQELSRADIRGLDAPALAARMRHAVRAAHEVDVAEVVFVLPSSLPRTTSGKLRRGEARSLHASGSLAVAGSWGADAAGPTPTPERVREAIETTGLAAQIDVRRRRDADGRVALEVAFVPRRAPSPVGRADPRDGRMGLGLFFFGSDRDEASAADAYARMLDAAERADAAGLEAVWTPERHFSVFGGQYPNPVATGAAVAARTKRIGVRAGSVVLPLHDPIRVAEDWAVVDNLSGGRAGLAVASGWHARDFVLAPGAHADRKARTMAAIGTLRALWSGEAVSASDGAETHEVRIRPLPVQPEIPLWLTAAGSDETFEAAGCHGLSVLTFLAQMSPDELAGKLALHRAAWGDRPGRAHATLMAHSFVAPTLAAARDVVMEPLRAYVREAADLGRGSGLVSAEDAAALAGAHDVLAERAAERFLAERGLFGSPRDCLERLESWRARGVGEVACLVDFGAPPDAVMDHLDLLFELNALCAKATEPPRTPDAATRIERHLLGAFPGLAGRLRIEVAERLPEPVADRLIAWLRGYAPGAIDSYEIDERRTVPPQILHDFARQGLFGLQVPEAEGGLGLSLHDALRVMEQLAAIDPTLALLVGIHNGLGIATLLDAAPPAMRAEVLPEFASGRGLLAFALTEPGAGSDPSRIAATARRRPDGRWSLSGEKRWIGLGGWARAVIVVCRLEEADGAPLGTGAFLVPADAPSFRVGPEALTMGVRGIVQNTLLFEDVVLDGAAMLGGVGDGLAIAARTLRFGRLGLSTIALGGMKRALQLMLRHAERRTIATGRLADNAVTRVRMGRHAARIAALEVLLDTAAGRIDDGLDVPEDLYAVAKLVAPEAYWEAVDDLVQALGGRGYEEPNEAPRLLRDARLFRIFEGPTETVGVHLGYRLLSGRADLARLLEDDRSLAALVARVPTPETADEATALALAQAAAATTMRRLAERGGVAPGLLRPLEEDAARAVAEIDRRVAGPPDQAAQIAETVEAYVREIGDLPGGVADDGRATAPEPRREGRAAPPDEPPTTAFSTAVAPPPAAVDPRLLHALLDALSEVLDRPRAGFGPDTPIDGLGLNSLAATRLVLALDERTGRELDFSAVFEARTIGDIAAAMAAPARDAIETVPATPVHDPILHFEGAHGARRLYCIHPASGSAAEYAPLAAALAGEIEVVGLADPGLAPGREGFASHAAMRDAHVRAIAAEADDRPPLVLGWSLGGHLAPDVAAGLAAAGHAVAGVAILDAVEGEPPRGSDVFPGFEGWLLAMARLRYPEIADAVARAARAERLLHLARAAVAAGEASQDALQEGPEGIERRLRRAHANAALLTGRPAAAPCPAPALVLRAADTAGRIADPALGWAARLAEIETADLPMRHAEMMRPDAAAQVADAIRAWLAKGDR